MGRQRMVRPELFVHEDLFEAERKYKMPLRVAYIGLWTQCDRDGRFEWRPARLRLAILPWDEVDFAKVLDALAKEGFILPYEAKGKRYGLIPSWSRHQKPHHQEPTSGIPAPTSGISVPADGAKPVGESPNGFDPHPDTPHDQGRSHSAGDGDGDGDGDGVAKPTSSEISPEGKKPKSKAKDRSDFAELIPEALRTDRFLAAWRGWALGRKSPLREPAAQVKLDQLLSWGLERAVAALTHSAGYEGLFEDTNGQNRNGTTPHRPGGPSPPPRPAQNFDPNVYDPKNDVFSGEYDPSRYVVTYDPKLTEAYLAAKAQRAKEFPT